MSKVADSKNNLLTKNKTLVNKFWDYEKNTLGPENYCPRSAKIVHWKCNKGHEWEKSIDAQTMRGCPYCSGHKPSKENNLSLVNDLVKQFDLEKNFPFKPENFTINSGKKIWWECKNGHSWQAVISSRTRINGNGCPCCANQKSSEDNNLYKDFKELCDKEWCWNRNKKHPKEYLSGSHIKTWWVCEKEHKWKAIIRHRTFHNTGCPYCHNKHPLPDKNLKILCPDLCLEWDFNKNKKLPEEFLPQSNKRAWWKCFKCNFEWKTKIQLRTIQGSGCPNCSQRVSGPEELWLNSLNISTRQHSIKIGKRNFNVDGFDPKTNTIYEFFGDYWHGNLDRFPENKINHALKKTMKELNQKTMDRIRLFEQNGYNVTYIWEKNFLHQIKNKLTTVSE